MKTWSDNLRRALDRCEHAVPVFFRDDDGGWADAELRALVGLFAEHETPIDLALIPTAVGLPLADWLAERAGPMLGLHQHGYEHVSHERKGRKCEFGVARGYRKQRQDIALGQHRLKSVFGRKLDPIFTPPWNRCTADTAVALRRLGFRALSRDVTAKPLEGAEDLRDIKVSVDWMKYRDGDQPDLAALGDRLAAQLGGDGPVGIMLHHAVMGEKDLRALAALLELLRSHLVIDCLPMRELIDPAAPRRLRPPRAGASVALSLAPRQFCLPRSIAELRG